MVFDATVWGPADGEPVLLLHGFPEGARCWDQVGPLLGTAGLYVVAPDQRGYSAGARPEQAQAYALDRLVDDAVGFVAAMGRGSAHVVAHDWGAIVGWTLAARHPELVRTLTAVSVPHPAAFGAALRDDPDQQQRSAYMRLFRTEGKAEQVLAADGGARLRRMFDGSGLSAADVSAVVDPLLEPGVLTAALSWYRGMHRADFASIPPVPVPTTYVWGAGDVAVGRVAAYGCAAQVTGPYRFVELDGVGHWIPEQRAEDLATLVVARIRE